MKRGPKTKLTRELQAHICKSLEKCNSIKTAMESAGLSERVFFDWMRNNPSFAAAVSRARATAKGKLVKVITDAAPKDFRAACWLLERSYPGEYSRVTVERVEQIEAEPKTVGCQIWYDTGGKTMEELLNFPVHSSMMERESESQVEQANVPAENAAETDNDEAPEAISDALPTVAPNSLTGRIDPSWKDNNGK